MKKDITFIEHKEQTAKDCESIADMIFALAKEVREGNMNAFEQYWIEGGTEEGDSKIIALRERLILRYLVRKDNITLS